MKPIAAAARGVIIATIMLVGAFSSSPGRAGAPPPYLGEWSNGRGDTLTITSKTMQVNRDRPVAYRDITRVTDGADFELQITAPGNVNAFPGKTLSVRCEKDSMQMTGYASHAAFMQGGDVQFEVRWDRDSVEHKDDSDDEES